jgi:CAF1 family ribonuclease
MLDLRSSNSASVPSRGMRRRVPHALPSELFFLQTGVLMVGHFLAKPFNFFVSPVVDPMFGFDRSFLCQASAIDMLCKEKLDFNHLFRHGIRYLSRQEECNVRKSEVDRVEGNRELAIIDEGGQKFLDQVKSAPPPNPLCAIGELTRVQGEHSKMARRSLRG